MTTVTSNDAASGGGYDELPENFFEDFENNEFLDELVGNVALNEEDDENDGNVESDDVPSTRRSRSSSPIVNRCLKEIDKLTQEIRRRKRRLQQGLSANDGGSRASEMETPTSTTENDKHERRSRRAARSRSPPRRSRDVYQTTRNRSRTDSRRSTRSRRRSRSRTRHVRTRDLDGRETRRPRSGSPPRKTQRRAASPPKSQQISFLEELERTFAKQGKTFPEKDLLLKTQNQPIIDLTPIEDYQPPAPKLYQDQINFQPLNDLLVAQHSGAQSYGRPHSSNALLPTPMYQEFNPFPVGYHHDLLFRPPVENIPAPVPPPVPVPVKNPPFNIQRCKQAIRIFSAQENKVPKSNFLFTPTCLKVDKTIKPTSDSPLSNAKNVSFQLTSRSVVLRPVKPGSLPTRSSSVVQTLGFSCGQLFEAIRMKSMASEVITKIQEKQSSTVALKTVTTKNVYVQTMPMECETCEERKNTTCLNQSVQTEGPKSVSIKVQTNTENYTEPVFNTLKSMTSAQLVAMTDFAHIVCDPRPSNSEEMFKLREQLMDVYNLSQRDDEAVRMAERQRLNSVRSLLSTHRRVTDGSTVSVSVDNNTMNQPNVQASGSSVGASNSTEAMIRDAEIELRLAEARENHSRPMPGNSMGHPNTIQNFNPNNNHPHQNQMHPGPPGNPRNAGFPWRGRGRGGSRGGGAPRGGNRWF